MILKDFKWVEIVEDDSEIVKNSALYMIPFESGTFKIVVVDDVGNQRVLENTGSPGENATIEIGDVIKLQPNELPTVENVGTETHAILDFGIPQGEKGEKGDPGNISMLTFDVDENMHLIMQLETDTNLDFQLNDDGHLILID